MTGRTAIALIIAVLLVAAPAAAEETTDDLVVTSSLCCLTPDAGPDTLSYSVMNAGDTTLTAIVVPIDVPEGMVADPLIDVWEIDALEPGASAYLEISLSPAPATVLGVSQASEPEPRPVTVASALPAWLGIA